ncbi:MAG: hypothetical protein AMXMBFR56_66270 [Polyangiaceae bacterium]
MKESPILFSAPMVRAILAGRKTMTRRLIRGLPDGAEPATLNEWRAAKADPRMADPSPRLTLFKRPVDPSEADGRGVLPSGLFGVPCPFGAPGDRLWVRETWAYHLNVDREETPEMLAWAREHRSVWYRASSPDAQTGCGGAAGRWRPSIFMPRWASRITLEVTTVRVERLQSITEADVFAEGVQLPIGGCEPECARKHPGQAHALVNALTPHKPALDPKCSDRDYAVAEFAVLWDSINGERAPWASNPWVWVVSFRREP